MNTGTPAVADPAAPGLGALACDGAGGSRSISLADAVAKPGAEPGAPAWLWVHLDHADPEHRAWLQESAGLDSLTCEALLEQETRPRFVTERDHMLILLRGVNLNPGSDPDDMISLRIWVEAHRVISLRHRRLLAVQDVRKRLLAGDGPTTPGELLVAVASRLVDRQAGVVDAMEDTVDEIEMQLMSDPGYTLRGRIAEFRRQAIGLRRYIAPQRDVLSRLVHEKVSWLGDPQRARLREVAERQIRLVEEVDSARERAGIAQEELSGRLSEQMNRNMYVLSLVAGVFLPLGLLTGLLGINVGGMPGVDSPYAFAVVCAVLLATAALVVWWFRRARLL